MANRKKRKSISYTEPTSPSNAKKRILTPEERNRALLRMLLLLALLAAIAFLYYFANSIYPYSFLFFYALALLLGFGYVILNRLFSRHGLTEASLPPTMSDGEKRAFLKARDTRKKQTAWMLYILIPLLLVIGFDVVYLLQGENIAAFFGKLK